MEEKERYEILNDGLIYDSYKKEYLFSPSLLRKEQMIPVCNLLNQQDKELSKLQASYQQVKEENQQLKQQLARTEKALELAVEQLDDTKDMLRECGKHDWAGMIDTSVDYFKARAREMLENE